MVNTTDGFPESVAELTSDDRNELAGAKPDSAVPKVTPSVTQEDYRDYLRRMHRLLRIVERVAKNNRTRCAMARNFPIAHEAGMLDEMLEHLKQIAEHFRTENPDKKFVIAVDGQPALSADGTTIGQFVAQVCIGDVRLNYDADTATYAATPVEPDVHAYTAAEDGNATDEGKVEPSKEPSVPDNHVHSLMVFAKALRWEGGVFYPTLAVLLPKAAEEFMAEAVANHIKTRRLR